MNEPKRIYISSRYANSLDIRVNDQEVEYICADLVKELVEKATVVREITCDACRFLDECNKNEISGCAFAELKTALKAVEEG